MPGRARDPMQSVGEALLTEVMRNGRRSVPSPVLHTVREHCSSELRALPPRLCELSAAVTPYPVSISATLQAMAASVDAETELE
jgi:hypothetical protein